MKELKKFEQSKELRRFIDDYNPGHDDTQIKHFVVGNNHTDYGRYKQAIAELSSHFEACKQEYIEKKKFTAEIGIKEAEIEELKIKGDRVSLATVALKEAEIEEKILGIDTVDKQIKRSLNELGKVFDLAKFYEKKIKGKDRVKLEKEYHSARLAKLLALNTVFRGNNLSGVMDVITTLPDDMQKPLLQEYRNLQQVDIENKLILENKSVKTLNGLS